MRTGWPDNWSMEAPNTGYGRRGPCLQRPVTLFQISTVSSTVLTWSMLTPPTTTTSSSPTGDTWLVHVCPVLAWVRRGYRGQKLIT